MRVTMNRKAKIVATLGPASEGADMLEKLVVAGVDVARLNFSHGTHEQHAARIAALRAISDAIGRPVDRMPISPSELFELLHAA